MTETFDPFVVFGRAEVVEDDLSQNYAAAGGDGHLWVPPSRLLNRPPIARFHWARDGGPVRTIIDGRKTRPTGMYPSIKAGFRSMPWDSILEEQTMQLADISSRVEYVLAQPHCIEIMVRKNRGKPLEYFPDLLLRVHPSFLRDLQNGVAFSDAAFVPLACRLSGYEVETVIIEVKADIDPRDQDDVYQDKLEFAKEVYRRRGFHFFEIRASKHLKPRHVRLARLMDWRKSVVIDIHDELACLDVFKDSSQTQRWRLENALGGGNSGRAKLHGLHYRGVVSIDLTDGISNEASVWLLRDRGHP